MSELDLHQTLHNALVRTSDEAATATQATKGKIKFSERDFELHLHEGVTSCSTVVLLDMSGSMMRYGRFLAAKKVALAMQGLIRSKFPQDSIDFVGFYSGAAKIPEVAVPLVMPKPVTVYDYQVRLKVPIDKLDQAPQHFTNLHMGLQMARRILRKRTSENKQIFIITDGQPTAHVEGDYVYLLYPPDQRSTVATLKEAVLSVKEGCRTRDVRADRRLLGHGLGRLCRSAHKADQGRGVLHQQRTTLGVHHGKLFERPEEEGVHRLDRLRPSCADAAEGRDSAKLRTECNTCVFQFADQLPCIRS